MNDNELEEYLKKIEPNFDSHIEKGTIEMSNEYYNLLEERMIRLLNENKQLKENKIDKAIEYIKHSQNYGTMAQVMPHLKPYVNGDDLLEILGDKENE